MGTQITLMQATLIYDDSFNPFLSAVENQFNQRAIFYQCLYIRIYGMHSTQYYTNTIIYGKQHIICGKIESAPKSLFLPQRHKSSKFHKTYSAG